MMVYICTKFHENILDGSKERTNFHGKNFKGGNSVKNVGGVMFFFSAHCLMVVYISTKFHENILDGI